MEDNQKYFVNTINYCQDLYTELLKRSKALNDEDEAERYIKFMAVSSAQECLFKIKELNNVARQLFGKDFDVREDLVPLINDIKPSFYFEGDKLMNVSGMEFSEMINFIKEAVAEKNSKDAGSKRS